MHHTSSSSPFPSPICPDLDLAGQRDSTAVSFPDFSEDARNDDVDPRSPNTRKFLLSANDEQDIRRAFGRAADDHFRTTLVFADNPFILSMFQDASKFRTLLVLAGVSQSTCKTSNTVVVMLCSVVVFVVHALI